MHGMAALLSKVTERSKPAGNFQPNWMKIIPRVSEYVAGSLNNPLNACSTFIVPEDAMTTHRIGKHCIDYKE